MVLDGVYEDGTPVQFVDKVHVVDDYRTYFVQDVTPFGTLELLTTDGYGRTVSVHQIVEHRLDLVDKMERVADEVVATDGVRPSRYF